MQNVDEIKQISHSDSPHSHLLRRHPTAEDNGDRQVATVTWVTSRHHVLRIEQLLCDLRYRDGAILLTSARRQRCEAGDEEVETRERHHVDGQLPQIGVQLTGEAEASRDAGQRRRHQMVEVTVRRRRQLQRPEADVVESLVVDDEHFVCVLDE